MDAGSSEPNGIMGGFEMKKIVLVQILFIAALAGIIYFIFSRNSTVELSLDKCAKIIQDNEKEVDLMDAGAMRVKRAFGINIDEFGDFVYFTSLDTMEVEEFFIVNTKDKANNGVIKKAMESRLDAQKKAFNGYGTDQTEVLSRAIIKESGNYVWYIVAPNAKEWQKRFLEKGGR